MLRLTFESELQRLQDEVLYLGSLVETAIVQSVDILRRRDLEGSRQLIAGDQAVNRQRYAIESDCLALIATQQPMARDLRLIAAVLEIAGELERISDYAKGIAKINLLLGAETPLLPPVADLPEMAAKTADMLHRALQAFVQRDVPAARSIPLEDDEVDRLYNQVFQQLIELILANPAVADRAHYLQWAAHNLERAADRVTNVCERVIFTVTGELVEMDVELEAPPVR